MRKRTIGSVAVAALMSLGVAQATPAQAAGYAVSRAVQNNPNNSVCLWVNNASGGACLYGGGVVGGGTSMYTGTGYFIQWHYANSSTSHTFNGPGWTSVLGATVVTNVGNR